MVSEYVTNPFTNIGLALLLNIQIYIIIKIVV